MSSSGRGRLIGGAEGFTLIELLVTILLIGILAAIALPLFLKQQDKAHDAAAKALASDGALALQVYATEHDTYPVDREDLLELAPQLEDAAGWELDGSEDAYIFSVTSDSDHVFTIERTRRGMASRTCTVSGAGGCGSGGTW